MQRGSTNAHFSGRGHPRPPVALPSLSRTPTDPVSSLPGWKEAAALGIPQVIRRLLRFARKAQCDGWRGRRRRRHGRGAFRQWQRTEFRKLTTGGSGGLAQGCTRWTPSRGTRFAAVFGLLLAGASSVPAGWTSSRIAIFRSLAWPGVSRSGHRGHLAAVTPGAQPAWSGCSAGCGEGCGIQGGATIPGLLVPSFGQGPRPLLLSDPSHQATVPPCWRRVLP